MCTYICVQIYLFLLSALPRRFSLFFEFFYVNFPTGLLFVHYINEKIFGWPIRKPNESWAHSDEEKADEFVKYFSTVFSSYPWIKNSTENSHNMNAWSCPYHKRMFTDNTYLPEKIKTTIKREFLKSFDHNIKRITTTGKRLVMLTYIFN